MIGKNKKSAKNKYDFSIKPDWYYRMYRKEMIKFVPFNSAKILDVGCSSGLFGEQLKKLLMAEVWGVELDPLSAKKASLVLKKVLAGDISLLMNDLPNRYFDTIVFNDVLEHLVDPFGILLKMKGKLTKNGVIVTSLPNIRYLETLKKLLIDKKWNYEDAGILDKTHLRFFTYKSIIEMFDSLEFDMIRIEGIHPIKSLYFKLFDLLTFRLFSDTRYMEFACVVKPRKSVK